jgi:hypothetical protein
MFIRNSKDADQARSFVSVKAVMNLNKKLVRNDTLQGKDYLVVPTVMLVEGVHSGSEGPYLYTNKEIGNRVELWNRKPVVVYHPDGPTACTKEVLNARGIGDIMNAKWDKKGKRLLAEAWLDEERVKKIDGRILEAIENEEVLELSTGLFADSDELAGEWGTGKDKEEFQGTLTNYGPDHLAVLPDQVGACSVEDGAGFYRNAKGQKITVPPSYLIRFNALSANAIRELLQKAISSDDGHWVEDVFIKEGYFIYSTDTGSNLYRRDFSVDKDDKITLKGLPVTVKRVVDYKPLTNKETSNKKGVVKMKEKLVNNLISNSNTQWEEDDRDYLMNLAEERLENMQLKEEKKEAKQTPAVTTKNEEDNNVQNTQNGNTDAVKNEKPVQLTEEEYKAQMPQSIRNRMERLERMENAEKDRMIATIKKNPKNTFTEEWLKTQDIEMLQNLVNIASGESKDDNSQPKIHRFNYGLQAEPYQSKTGDVSNVPVLNAPGDVKSKTA